MNYKDKYKLAAFDVDGTLLVPGDLVFSKNIKNMFLELKKNNVITTLATAREFASINNFLEQLNPDYFIGANGSFVWDVKNKKFIFTNVCNKEDVIKLYDEFATKVEGFQISHFDKVFKSPTTNTNTWYAKPFEHKFEDYSADKLIDDQIHLITLNQPDPKKVQELVKNVTKFIKQNKLDLEISSLWSRGIFIAPPMSNKIHALEKLASYLNLGLENIIAFGDGENDYEMIKNVGYGVAIDDSSNELKAIAKDICLSCEVDGPYHKLKELEII